MVSSLVIGLIALIIYVARQLKMAHPTLNLKALANPGFLVGTLLVMINFGITLSAMFLLPQYLQNGLLLPCCLNWDDHVTRRHFKRSSFICFRKII